MSIIKQLNIQRVNAANELALVNQLFSCYLKLNIPYETISNLNNNVLIKTPEEMVSAIQSNMGGHCVEHTLLLCSIMQEYGLNATYINADNIDHRYGATSLLSKPYILLSLEDKLLLLDVYYRQKIFNVPKQGSHRDGRFIIQRINDMTVNIRCYGKADLVSEEIARFQSGELEKRQQFQNRYKEFTPFGVTAPFYQVVQPIRRGIYYDVDYDSITLQDGKDVTNLSLDALHALKWVPTGIKDKIPQFLSKIRNKKSEIIQFFSQGDYLPIYKLLRVKQ